MTNMYRIRTILFSVDIWRKWRVFFCISFVYSALVARDIWTQRKMASHIQTFVQIDKQNMSSLPVDIDRKKKYANLMRIRGDRAAINI